MHRQDIEPQKNFRLQNSTRPQSLYPQQNQFRAPDQFKPNGQYAQQTQQRAPDQTRPQEQYRPQDQFYAQEQHPVQYQQPDFVNFFPREEYEEKGSGAAKGFAMFFACLTLIAGTGFGVFHWQNRQAEGEQKVLLSKIDELGGDASELGGGEVKSALSAGKTFTYKGSVGGLELNLSEKYGVVVKVDGNYGPTQRTILHISEKQKEGIYLDILDNYIEVDVSKTKKSPKDELAEYQKALKNNGYSLKSPLDATIGDHKGYLLSGQSTNDQIRIYFIHSGEHAYKFAQVFPIGQPDEDNHNLLAVIKGMSIKNQQ